MLTGHSSLDNGEIYFGSHMYQIRICLFDYNSDDPFEGMFKLKNWCLMTSWKPVACSSISCIDGSYMRQVITWLMMIKCISHFFVGQQTRKSLEGIHSSNTKNPHLYTPLCPSACYCNSSLRYLKRSEVKWSIWRVDNYIFNKKICWFAQLMIKTFRTQHCSF